MTSTPEPPAQALLPTLALLAIVGSGVAAWFSWQSRSESQAAREELARASTELAELRRAVQLMRFEKGGASGPTALLEQLRFWAPKLQNATTPAAEVPEVQRKIADLHDAFGAVGKDAQAALETAFRNSTSDSEDEFRRQCLIALGRAAPLRARDLLVQLVKSIDTRPSPRLRLIACDELTRLDKALAGQTLRDVLATQSSQGVNLNRLAPEYAAKIAGQVSGAAAWSGFFNLVGKYLATEDAETDATLQMLLNRAEHDRTTIAECVKALGARRCKDALGRIQELYKSPPPPVEDPIFRNHCLEAISAIAGESARPFFDEALRNETNPIVQTKLQDLLKLVR